MATNGTKQKFNVGENKPSISNGQKRGRNDKWGAKMKEKLKAALSQKLIQSEENTTNALKSKIAPNEKTKKSNSSRKTSNGEHVNQNSVQNNDRTRKNSAVDQTNEKHLNGLTNKEKQKETSKKVEKNENKPKNSAMKTGKSQEIITKSQTTSKSQTNGINLNKEKKMKKLQSSRDIQGKTKKLPKTTGQNSFDKTAKEAKTATKKKLKSSTSNTFNSADNKKRKIANVEEAAVLKRAKLSKGFVESNVDDIQETQRINRELKDQKTTSGHSKQTNSVAPDVGPPVIVHNIPIPACSSESDADSETDSYIDKFFDDPEEEGQQFDDMSEEATSEDDISDESGGSDDMDHEHGVEDSDEDSNENSDEGSDEYSDEDSDSSAEFGIVCGSDEEGEEEEVEDSSDDGWEYSDDSLSCEGDSNSSYDECGSDCDSYGSLGSEVSSNDDYSYFHHGNQSNYESAEDSDYAGELYQPNLRTYFLCL